MKIRQKGGMVVGGGTQSSRRIERGVRASEGKRERERNRRGRVGRRNVGWRREEKRREATEGGGCSYESGAAVFVSPSYGHHVRRD